jgi:hypothetical protein
MRLKLFLLGTLFVVAGGGVLAACNKSSGSETKVLATSGCFHQPAHESSNVQYSVVGSQIYVTGSWQSDAPQVTSHWALRYHPDPNDHENSTVIASDSRSGVFSESINTSVSYPGSETPEEGHISIEVLADAPVEDGCEI